MSRTLKILRTTILFLIILTQDKVCTHVGFGQAAYHNSSSSLKKEKEPMVNSPSEIELPKNDSIYHWDEQLQNWSAIGINDDLQATLADNTFSANPLTIAKEIKWKVLMNIRYQRKYFKKLETEMYAPVFSDAIKKIDGQEVIIEGFVIPFDEEGKLLALSYNPYASCFFCGNASPASVISLYLKDKDENYKIDDFKKFRGTLYLNYDDPDNFYYILKDAIEE